MRLAGGNVSIHRLAAVTFGAAPKRNTALPHGDDGKPARLQRNRGIAAAAGAPDPAGCRVTDR